MKGIFHIASHTYYYVYYCRSWFSWHCALFLWCYHRLSINIRRDIILSKSLQPKSHPKSESRPICKHKSIAQVVKVAYPLLGDKDKGSLFVTGRIISLQAWAEDRSTSKLWTIYVATSTKATCLWTPLDKMSRASPIPCKFLKDYFPRFRVWIWSFSASSSRARH